MKYIDRATPVFKAADQAALDTGAGYIDTLHILLGIRRATDLLGPSGDEIERRVLEELRTISPGSGAGFDQLERVIEEAIEEGRLVGAPEVDAQLVLAGLCRVEGSRACQLLADFGITLESVRKLWKEPQEPDRTGHD